MARYQLRFRRFDGEWSPTISRELMERTPAAGILPYDPESGEVLLIEQFRPGAMGKKDQSPWMLEIIAGIITPHDPTAAELVKREAREEANCEILDIYPICEYFVSPGGSNEYFHLFCGRMHTGEKNGFYGLAEEGEDIRAFAMPLAEALMLVEEGKIKTAPAIIALQWLQRHQLRLNKLWLKK